MYNKSMLMKKARYVLKYQSTDTGNSSLQVIGELKEAQVTRSSRYLTLRSNDQK